MARQMMMRRELASWGALCVVLCLVGISLLACVGDGEEFDEETGPDHACFVHCQAAFGISSACFSSGSDYRSDSACMQKASDYCGEQEVSRAEMVSECNCSASCEPDWYNQ